MPRDADGRLEAPRPLARRFRAARAGSLGNGRHLLLAELAEDLGALVAAKNTW